MEAIILAGGLGTRLRGVISDQQKVLASIAGRPFLEYLFQYLMQQRVRRVVLSVCYKKEQIEKKYGNSFGALQIAYCEEEEPLGTGGAIQQSLRLCKKPNVFVLNGDSIFLAPFKELNIRHQEHNATVTIAVRKVEEGNRYGGVAFDPSGRIQNFQEKGIQGPVFINGGIYLINKNVVERNMARFDPPFSIEKDIFPALIRKGLPLFAVWSDAFFLDIGTPESYQAAQTALPQQFSDFRSGSNFFSNIFCAASKNPKGG